MMSGLIMSLIIGHAVAGQAPKADTMPVVTAGFLETNHSLDWNLIYHGPEVCVSRFERVLQKVGFDSIKQQTKEQREIRANFDDPWRLLPLIAVKTGWDCQSEKPFNETQQPDFELGTLLQLAIAINNDSLVEAVVDRQMELAGSAMRARAQVLERAIDGLMSNAWDEGEFDTDHLTQVHVQLAHSYAAQLDSCGPAALLYRLRAAQSLAKGMKIEDGTDSRAFAELEQRLRTAQQEVSAAPAEDRHAIDVLINGINVKLTEMTYRRSLTHEDLIQSLEARRQGAGLIGWQSIDSLVGKLAPPIRGDYWFPTPDGPMPIPGDVSLIVFDDPQDINPSFRLSERDYAELRRLHSLFPALQIVLVGMTRGVFQGHFLWQDPAEEARMVKQLLIDSLRVPGILCIIKGEYHTVEDGRVLPLVPPQLKPWKLDPRLYGRHVFLVDKRGWIVKAGMPSSPDDEELIRHLLQ